MKPVWLVLIAAGAFAQTTAFAQTSGEPSMKQLMLDLIHPASNDILLFVNRGGSKNDGEWAAVRRSALTLAESGNLLTMRGRARDQGDWVKDANSAGRRWKGRLHGCRGQGLERTLATHRIAGCSVHHLSQTVSAERVSA